MHLPTCVYGGMQLPKDVYDGTCMHKMVIHCIVLLTNIHDGTCIHLPTDVHYGIHLPTDVYDGMHLTDDVYDAT